MIDFKNILITEYRNILTSSSSSGTISLHDVARYIKGEDNSHIHLIEQARKDGKYNETKSYTVTKYKKAEKVNYYEYVKTTKVKTFGFNVGLAKRKRRIKSQIQTKQLSGLMYFDVDNIFIDVDIDTFKQALHDSGHFLMLWKSFGAKGLGMIVQAEGLDVYNFTNTWYALRDKMSADICAALKQKFPAQCNAYDAQSSIEKEKKGIYFEFDEQTKDTTRLTVGSYDKDLLINENSTIFPAVEDTDVVKRSSSSSSTTSRVVKLNPNYILEDVPDGFKMDYGTPEWLQRMYAHSLIKSMLLKDSNFDINEKGVRLRPTYRFYQNGYSVANQYGVSTDVYMEQLNEAAKDKATTIYEYRDASEVQDIIEHNAKSYEAQHGAWWRLKQSLRYKNVKFIELNKEFEGDERQTNIVLEYLHLEYNNKNVFKLASDELKHFCVKAKEFGLQYPKVAAYLVNNKHKDSIIEYLHEVYCDTNIAFGVRYEYCEQSREALLKRMNHDWGEKGYTFLPAEKYDDEKVLEIFKRAPDIKDGIVLVASIAMSQMWSFDKASEVFFEMYAVNHREQSAYKELICIELEEQRYREGLELLPIPPPKDDEDMKFDQHIILNEDEYLGDYELIDSRNLIIWSDTGTGKTFSVRERIKYENCIVCAPNIALAKQIARDLGVKFIGDGEKKVPKDCSMVVTYASLPYVHRKLSAGHTGKDDVLEDYAIIVDEAHNLVSSSSKDFRLEDMNYLRNTFGRHKRTVLLTGTWLNIYNTEFEEYDIVRCEKKKVTQYEEVFYAHKNFSIASNCAKIYENNPKFKQGVFLNNKKQEGDLGSLVNALERQGIDRKKVCFINSDERANDACQSLIATGRLLNKYSIYIFTSFISEGVNINDFDVSAVHFGSKCHPAEMQQIVARFRRCQPKVYLYTKGNSKAVHNGFKGAREEQTELQNDATEICSDISCMKSRQKLMKFMDIKFLKHDGKGNYHADELEIANHVFNRESAYCNYSSEHRDKKLSVYGWEKTGSYYDGDDFDKKTKKEMKAMSKLAKENIYTAKQEIAEYISKLKEDVPIDEMLSPQGRETLMATSAHPEYLMNSLIMVNTIRRYMAWDSVLSVYLHWHENCNGSTSKMRQILDQVYIAHKANNGEMLSHFDINDCYYKYFVGYMSSRRGGLVDRKLFNKRDILFHHNKAVEHGQNSVVPKTNDVRVALEWMNKIFVITRQADARGSMRYVLDKIRLENEIAYQYNEMKKLHDELLNTEGLTTQFEVGSRVLEIKQNTIISARSEQIRPTSAMECYQLFAKYFSMNVKSRRWCYADDGLRNLFDTLDWKTTNNVLQKDEKLLLAA